MYEIMNAVYGVDYTDRKDELPGKDEVAIRDWLEGFYSGSGPMPVYIGIQYDSLPAFEMSDPDWPNTEYPDEDKLEEDWEDYIAELQSDLTELVEGDEFDVPGEPAEEIKDFAENLDDLEPEKIIVRSTS